MRIALVGYGAMGHVLEQTVRETDGMEIVVIAGKEIGADIYAELSACTGHFDCIIDFSHHSNLIPLLRFARENKKPLVIAVTGFTEERMEMIKQAAKDIPVLQAQNLSIGITLLTDIVKRISEQLGDGFDIEIIEKHHRFKEDAPSGTAKMLVGAISGEPGKTIIHGRTGMKKRGKEEIGVHSVRGGTIAGEHTVIFAGNDELIEIKHTALSKRIFADGAIRAARFLVRQNPGSYTMSNVLAH